MSGTLSLPSSGGHFTILNGNCPDWSCKEIIAGQFCSDPNNWDDRNVLLGGFTQDTTLNLQFGTCASPGSCPHTFNMYDSWGDGWNGGSVDVLVNGTTVITGATCTGAFTVLSFNAGNGDLIELANWNPGSYPGEITWDVTDGFGNILGSGNTTITAVGTGNCSSCFIPSTLTTTNITSSSANLGWTANGTETTWNIEYGLAGFAAGNGTIVSVTTNPYVLTD